MLKKILLFTLVTMIISCGKDVVVVDETPIPNDAENVFEVNLVGLPHDNNGVYIPEVNFTFKGSDISGDLTGFFHAEKQLIGNSGSVVKAEKAGYLPIYKRIYHHNSLEDVIVDVTLPVQPTPKILDAGGLEFEDENNVKVIIEDGDLSDNSELIFYTDLIGDDKVTYIDNLLDGDIKKILDASLLLFIDSDNQFINEQSASIEIANSELDGAIIDELELFFYDEAINSWVSESSISKTADHVSIEVNRFGWWAVANVNRAAYATLTLDQLGQPISTYKSQIKHGQSTEVLYTSISGQVSKYWPIDESVGISFENSQAEVIVSVAGTNQPVSASVSEEINIALDGQVLSCNLDLHNGYVAVLSEGQHTIIPIDNGEFIGNTSISDETVQLNFYNSNYESMAIQSANVSDWKSTQASFVACEKTLSLKDTSSTIADFENCRVRVNPFESLIIGGEEDLGIFMASFSGDQVGVYDGLLFSTATSLEAEDINSSAEVNILLYDEISRTVAGKIDGVFLTGEPFNISFIGNIE